VRVLAEDDSNPMSVSPATRLAPSPTGPLHLGHARTFLLTWALARREGWRIVLRLEDLDRQRVVEGARASTIETLEWLGLDHDGPIVTQSEDLAPYEAAMRRLAAQGETFACELSRREIREAASAPHGHAGEVRFDPSLRPAKGEAWQFDRPDRHHRFLVREGVVEFEDRLLGPQRFDPSQECGDFAIWTRDGVPSYQLAVVVDDARHGVTEVVRGDDLLASTARQILLQEALDLPRPNWWHLPLVADAAGERLAKRGGALAIESLRAEGVIAPRICGLVCWWNRWIDDLRPIEPRMLPELATPASLRVVAEHERDPSNRPRVDEETLRWLRIG
jgi:glutamyl-tRNA synthetase